MRQILESRGRTTRHFCMVFRVVGSKIPGPTGHEPIMSTPYPERGNGGQMTPSQTGRPSSPETIEFGPEIITVTRPAAEQIYRPAAEPRQGYRPAAPIQRFNNKSLNWPAWFRHFRAVADVHGWSKEQRANQPFDDASVGDSEDDDLIPIQSGEDWVAQLDDDLSRPASQSGEVFKIAALQRDDLTCTTLLGWIRSDDFPPWAEVKSMCPELRFLWHHRNNLSADTNGVMWRKRSSQTSQLQLLVPKPGRNGLFLSYHATLIAGHLGRNRTLARLSQRFYWSGMADDVGDWLRNCTTCLKRKSPAGRHHPLGNIPTGHRWDRIAMDILDVCDPTPDGFRYILVIADYFSKWTEAFPIKNKCADTVAEVLVDKIILRFGMPLVIHSDQGREFENGLMKSLCSLLGCVKTRTAPYHPESDGMVERFNRTCLMMLSMFVNDRRDNWHKLLPFVMHAYRTSVHESTGYSPYRLMMGEECSLAQDLNTEELRANRESDVAPHPFAAWVRDALAVAYDHVRHSLHRTAARRKRLYDVKDVNRKFPVGSWVLRYYPPAAQKKLGSPWIGPQLVVRCG